MTESGDSGSRGLGTVGAYVERVTRETRDYLAEILKENARLRTLAVKKEIDERVAAAAAERVTELEEDNRGLRDAAAQLDAQAKSLALERQAALAEVGRLTTELARTREQLANAESEHRDFADRFGAIDRKNTNLTYLHVTSHRLHSTLDRREILDAVAETIVNLVGSEDFAVYELDPSRESLDLALGVGAVHEDLRSLPLGVGALGEAAARGEALVAGADDGLMGVPGGRSVMAMVPLKRDGTLVGAIVIFSLLPQKNGTFDEIDFEIFDLLASQAATALYCARLHLEHAEAN